MNHGEEYNVVQRMLQEAADLKEARDRAVHLELPPTNAELNEQFMSKEALDLKRKTPLFNPIPL
jgi:hypothetical protein